MKIDGQTGKTNQSCHWKYEVKNEIGAFLEWGVCLSRCKCITGFFCPVLLASANWPKYIVAAAVSSLARHAWVRINHWQPPKHFQHLVTSHSSSTFLWKLLYKRMSLCLGTEEKIQWARKVSKTNFAWKLNQKI